MNAERVPSSVPDARLIVALDFDNQPQCLSLVERLNPAECRLKVGKELFAVGGPSLVQALIAKGFDVFLDLKYHDIPNTVAKAVQAAARLGVWMLNVHASGGSRMLAAAREAADSVPGRKPLLIGVTVLTSMGDEDLAEIGVQPPAAEQVMRLAGLCKKAGLDGVVCSAREAAALKREFGPDLLLVTPGIRPAGSGADDQRRTLTPAGAVAAGTDYLVVGRPITAAADPALACREILDSLPNR